MFHSFKQKFARLLRVFTLADDTRNGRAQLYFPVGQFPFGEIRWHVVDLQDGKYDQVVVKPLSLEASRYDTEYNSQIMYAYLKRFPAGGSRA
jgi:hypothetical protein